MKKIIICLLGFTFLLSSCIKDTFDNPSTSPSGGGGGTGNAVYTSIKDLRAAYSGNGIKVVDKYIEVTVISDKDGKNLNSNNMVVQDATGGIVVRFSSSNTFTLGDKLKIVFVGDSVTKFSGLMQVFIGGTTNVTKTGNSPLIPTTATIAAITADMAKYESTLVKIVNATFPTGTYSGSKTINDGSGSITHYTASSATFSAATMPTTAVSVTGIVGVFGSTKQVSIRNQSDIQ